MKTVLRFALLTVSLAALVAAVRPTVFDIAQRDGFTTLVAALQAADLVHALSDKKKTYTVFAPTNDAFASLPSGLVTKLTTDTQYSEHLKELLQYHLVKGVILSTDISDDETLVTVQGEDITATNSDGDIFINDNAKVVLADVKASNGVVHAIDHVLVPSFLNNDVVTVAASRSTFSTLVSAVTAAGLVDTLKGTGPFTVFAPNNAAFAKLGQSAIAALLADPTKLANILKYHVVSGIITADQLQSGAITTVGGSQITVKVGPTKKGKGSTTSKGGQSKGKNKGRVLGTDIGKHNIYLNGNSHVVAINILASNGYIYEIDTVLSPP